MKPVASLEPPTSPIHTASSGALRRAADSHPGRVKASAGLDPVCTHFIHDTNWLCIGWDRCRTLRCNAGPAEKRKHDLADHGFHPGRVRTFTGLVPVTPAELPSVKGTPTTDLHVAQERHDKRIRNTCQQHLFELQLHVPKEASFSVRERPSLCTKPQKENDTLNNNEKFSVSSNHRTETCVSKSPHCTLMDSLADAPSGIRCCCTVHPWLSRAPVIRI